MAEDTTSNENTVKVFNVENISVRLVNIGGVLIPPGQIAEVFDDEAGINRRDVESSEWLAETDEKAHIKLMQAEANKAVEQVKTNKKATAAAKTASGKGWASK